MKYLLIFLAVTSLPSFASTVDTVNQKSWAHGAEDCRSNKDPAIDIFQFDQATFVLRQNKCVHYEAPFIYVLFGEHTVFVQDTGATADADKFPLYETLQMLIDRWEISHHSRKMNLLVTHSHSHSDHTAADRQFRNKPGVTLIEPNAQSVHQYFGFTDWPNGMATVELGERQLTVLPVPGHHDESIAVYDSQTQWLLSGDSLYPGRLYIKDWSVYRASIQRLVAFSKTHKISAIMGSHIEMSNQPGKDYPAGSTFHPDEAGLALSVDDLLILDSTLKQLGENPQEKTMPKFIISPLGMFQRILGTVMGWLVFW
jgi:glyoxylase-like metal-dependent hydrolase (beta-lactamase superfamily II)